jgi:misacylated tRNA(Ala) deacylase
MTVELFREDSYLKECEANVVSVDERGICLDRTIFYPMGGGQPGDSGTLLGFDGTETPIADTFKDRETGDHLHVPSEGAPLPAVGDKVTLRIDWDRRYRLMRMHSCMHLLCAVVPAGVTGGSVREDSARLDFDLPDPPDKLQIEEDLKRLIAENHSMRLEWITDEDLEQQPELVRTMSVKPPTGAGRVRLVRFEGVDLQPCGGTHVAATGEIGRVRVRKIEKKGKKNRRITVEFV